MAAGENEGDWDGILESIIDRIANKMKALMAEAEVKQGEILETRRLLAQDEHLITHASGRCAELVSEASTIPKSSQTTQSIIANLSKELANVIKEIEELQEKIAKNDKQFAAEIEATTAQHASNEEAARIEQQQFETELTFLKTEKLELLKQRQVALVEIESLEVRKWLEGTVDRIFSSSRSGTNSPSSSQDPRVDFLSIALPLLMVYHC